MRKRREGEEDEKEGSKRFRGDDFRDEADGIKGDLDLAQERRLEERREEKDV